METGNDLFFVVDAGDLVIELADGGAETIIVSVNMTMPDQVEVLQIASGISGITITGGAGRKSGGREAPKCFTFCIDHKLKGNYFFAYR
jgi:hypothetical protein